MKNLLILAIACVTLVACNSEHIENTKQIGQPFEKGQKVILGISASGTKVISDVGATSVSHLWEEGDRISVKVDEEASSFKLKSGAGTSTATFEGEMPASGTTFSVNYPEAEPELDDQECKEGQVPDGKLSFYKDDCTLDTDIALSSSNAVLNIQLYGTDKTVGKIQVTLGANDGTRIFTLTCNGGKTVSSQPTAPTPFFIVVPTSKTWKDFSFEVFDPNNHSIKQFTGTSKDFDENTVYDLPAQSLD